jgi:cytochrome c peroxidase
MWMFRQTPLVQSVIITLLCSSCQSGPEAPPLDPKQQLIEKGRQIFFNETFSGNGRTCGTCHPAENNFTIDPAFIATLPPDNPLFVAEFIPALKENFEKPRLMREFGLILENLDGFDDLDSTFVLRGVPHTLGLGTSVASPQGPRLGWSGDGAPGDFSLRSFAVGAVIQHFTKSLQRVPGVDFRLPTDEELDALEAFQLSLGRQAELSLPLPLRGTVADLGQKIFMDNTLGKCNICHQNAGANVLIPPSRNLGNANFNTGVEDLPDIPQKQSTLPVPRDNGFGFPGDSTFNVPSLVEAADTGPFFHNNAVETIEGAVAFYAGNAFNNSPTGKLLAGLDPRGKGIELDATQIIAIAAFLRVINALENIRQASEFLKAASFRQESGREQPESLLERAMAEIEDAIQGLSGGGLHPRAIFNLRDALATTQSTLEAHSREQLIDLTLRLLQEAREEMIE